MAFIRAAFLAAALPAVFAVPQHAHSGHGPYKGSKLPSGFPTGFPQPSGIPGTAPYPAQNGTVGGPTGTGAGAGPVTIQSTINVVPLPVTSTVYAASSTKGVGESGASGSPGSGSGSGSSSGSGSGSGESGAACGPATVTVTQAKTITVTVPGSNGGAPSNAPVQSSPAASSVPAVPSTPYPIGNSSVPAGPASTGIRIPAISSQAPVISSAEASSSVAPVEVASSAASPPASVAPTSSVVANAYYHVPEQSHSSVPPVVPSSSSVVFPAPVTSSSSSAPAEQATTSAPAPVASSSASQVASSAPISSSSTPAKSNSGVKARGLLYGGTPFATAIANANSYLESSNGAMGWGWDWDSSPSPQSGPATGTLNVQFVPMILSAADTHTQWWDQNSAGHPYLMGFNEPDMTLDKGGSQMDVNTCVAKYMEYLDKKKSDSTKLISPATTNNLDDPNMGVHYMSNFLASCKQQNCHIDVLAFHYYGEASDLQYFKNTVQKFQALQSQYQIPELWITEMAPLQAPTADQMSAFLEFLDDPSSGVDRYAFNGLNTNSGQSLDMPVIKSAYQA